MKKILLLLLAAGAMPALVAADTLPVTDGLTVWLDASDTANLVFNDSNQITNWINRAPDGQNFTTDNNYGTYSGPIYSSTGLNGKGAVVFGLSAAGEHAHTMLATMDKLKSQTIFVATMITNNQWTNQGVLYGLRGGQYASTGICRDYGVNKLRWIKEGFGGQGWLNGAKWLDEAHALAPSGYEPSANVSHVITSMRTVAWDAVMTVGEGNTGQHYDWFGPVGEIVVFDRQLTTYERVKIENYLMAKWTDKTIKIWNGGDGKWSEEAKWTPTGVPTATDLVSIPAGTVTVEGSAAAAALTVEGNLSLSSYAVMSIGRGGLGGSATLTLNHGSRLVASADFSGASSGTQTLNYSGDATIGAGYYGSFTLPAVVNADGRLFMHGLGNLVFSSDGPTTGVYDLTCGGSAIDFGGKTVKCSSLRGATPATNLVSTTAAKVEFDIADDGELSVKLAENTEVTKKGTGTLKVAGGSLMDAGKAEVRQGSVTTTGLRLPISYPGLVFHLDASDVSSWSTNANGQLTAVYSHTADNQYCYVRSSETPKWSMPYLSPTGINDRPAFAFALAAQNTYALSAAPVSSMCGSKNVICRTVVLVAKSVGGWVYSSKPTIFGLWASTSQRIVSVGSLKDAWDFSTCCARGTNLTNGLFTVNGKVAYDYNAGITSQTSVSMEVGKVQLIVMTADNGDASSSYIPYFGNNITGVSSAWGGYIGEVLIFDRVLGESERKNLEAQLMAKWGIESAATEPTAASDTLEPLPELSLAAGTTLDLGGMTQAVGRLTLAAASSVTNGTVVPEALAFAADAQGAVEPVLGDADWALDETDIEFDGSAPAHSGRVVQTSGSVSGTLGTVSGAKRNPAIRPHYLGFIDGLMLLIR